jgi:hypothetical protein
LEPCHPQFNPVPNLQPKLHGASSTIKFGVYLTKHSCGSNDNDAECKITVRINAQNTEVIMTTVDRDVLVNGIKMSDPSFHNQDLSIDATNPFFTTVTGAGWSVQFSQIELVYITVTSDYADKVRHMYVHLLKRAHRLAACAATLTMWKPMIWSAPVVLSIQIRKHSPRRT